MEELDKQLDEIVNNIYSAGNADSDLELYGSNRDEIEQIKQVFRDAGWKDSAFIAQDIHRGMTRDAAHDAQVEIEAAEYFKKYMISTSPFIRRIIDPYIEEKREFVKKAAGIEQ